MVERGLACGCVCPWCEEPLVARKGEEREHHFAHLSAVTCEKGLERSLQLGLGQVLGEAEGIYLPSVTAGRKNSERIYGLPVGEVRIVKIQKEIELVDGDGVRRTAAAKLTVESDGKRRDIYLDVLTDDRRAREELEAFYRSLTLPALGLAYEALPKDGTVDFKTIEGALSGGLFEWIFIPTLEELRKMREAIERGRVYRPKSLASSPKEQKEWNQLTFDL